MGGGQTNEEDIAAVTEVARSYYEGMIAGDEALLSRAFHPRACIVGNSQGSWSGSRWRSSSPSARRGPKQQSGPPCGDSMVSQSRVTRL
jgi:hypothetical protein